MSRVSPEFAFAVLAIALIGAAYVVMLRLPGVTPDPGGLEGHLIGVLGFVLMVMTEILYSMRKRSTHGARWGSMRSWLQFHIFTGIVGPYMVLLHSGWHFNGLAGLTSLLTLAVVASGFVGRYIYTALPRTAQGAEMASGDVESLLARANSDVETWLTDNPTEAGSLPLELVVLPDLPLDSWRLVAEHAFSGWRFRVRWWKALHALRGTSNRKASEIEGLLTLRRKLQYQVATLLLARRALALWHTIHVPMGVALFSAAFIHVVAALYFVTLAR